MLSHLCNIDASIEKIRKRKCSVSDIFGHNGIISDFRSRTRYVVLVFHADSHIRKIYAHRKNHVVTPTLNSRHVEIKKFFFKNCVICLPRDRDPSKLLSINYLPRHLSVVLLKEIAVQELSNSLLHLKGQYVMRCHFTT